MGLFGGGGKSTVTTVKADPHVTAILKDIMGEVKDTPIDQFIAKQYANFTPEQRQQLQQVAASGNTRQVAGILSPSFEKGMQQAADNNKYLQSELNSPVTVNQVMSDRNLAVTNNLNKETLNKAITAPSSSLKGSAGARVAMRRNAGLLTASNAFNRGAQGAKEGVSQRLTNQANRVGDINTMANIAQGNVSQGLQGVALNRQATQNQLQVGNILQQNQQAANQVAYNNANAAALFPSQQLQNRTNLVTQAANMAGYKQYGTQASNVGMGTKLAGVGLGVLGTMGSTGAFTTQPGNQGLGFMDNWTANANKLGGYGDNARWGMGSYFGNSTGGA